MNAEVAVGLFGAYAAVLSIIVLYQTLVLQAIVDRLDRAELEKKASVEPRYKAQRTRRANLLLAQTALFSGAVGAAMFLVASYADFIAGLVDPMAAPREAFTYPVWILRALFIFVSGYYIFRIVPHPYVRAYGFRGRSADTAKQVD